MNDLNDRQNSNENRSKCPASDWNPLSPEALADPAAAQAKLRQHCPFPYTDQQGGFRAITRYADIVKAAADPDSFKNGLRPKLGHRMPPLETDPPVHTAYRRLLQPHFNPIRMRKMEEQLRAFTIGILEPLIKSGKADFANELAFVLPIRAFCNLLNLPDEDWTRIKSWSEDAYTIFAHMPDKKERFDAANAALYAYAHEILADRKKNPRDPADDIVTLLSQSKINDEPIPDEEIVSIMRLLLTAGHESTASSLGNCILYLAQNFDAQSQLRNDPSKIPTAIEEILRWDTPVMAMPRVVDKDTEIAGHRFYPGEYVYLLYSSGNRDSEKFENADSCLLDRKPNPHLAFGHGIHTCMGAPLARVEIKVALEELLKRTASFTLNGEPTRTIFHRRGVLSLPLTLTSRE